MTAAPAPPMLVNGESADTVAVADRGFQYGDGLFETIKVTGGIPEFWGRHMARLNEGCRRLAIPAPDGALLRREAEELCAGAANAVLKIIVTRGTGGRGYRPPERAIPTRVVALYPAPDYPPEFWRQGVRVRLCETRMSRQPRLAGIKHMNRLEQVLARGEWTEGHIAEGVMLDTQGLAIEGTMTNLFLARDGALVTPDLSRCGVAGIIRAVLLELAEKNGIETQVRDISQDALESADEIFLTNSVVGVWPVRELGTREYYPGPVTEQLRHALAAAAKD